MKVAFMSFGYLWPWCVVGGSIFMYEHYNTPLLNDSTLLELIIIPVVCMFLFGFILDRIHRKRKKKIKEAYRLNKLAAKQMAIRKIHGLE